MAGALSGKKKCNCKCCEEPPQKKILSTSIRPDYSFWPENFTLQADAGSAIAMYAIKELKDAGRLSIKTIQTAAIRNIEGNKGSNSFGRGPRDVLPAFARTASHTLRMVFLLACGVDPEHWPTGGESSFRNQDKMEFKVMKGEKYHLASDFNEAREYFNEFDKMYPHYVIEKHLEEQTGTLNNMMFIFKNYMQEVVEITMRACAAYTAGNKVCSKICCVCVHRSIDLKGAEGKWLDRLNMIVRGSVAPLATHFNVIEHLCAEAPDAMMVGIVDTAYDQLPQSPKDIIEPEDLDANGLPRDTRIFGGVATTASEEKRKQVKIEATADEEEEED